jgi:cytoskeleton protein RodZ
MGEFGQLLRQLREAQGESVESLTQATRIPLRHLLALEAEQFQLLPNYASGRGFVRLLAKHYRMDAQELVRQYECAVAPHGGVAPPPLAQTNATIFKVQSGRRHVGLGMGVGLIVLILLLFGWMRGMQELVGRALVTHDSTKGKKVAASRPTSKPATPQEKPRPTEEPNVKASATPPSVPLKSETIVAPAATPSNNTPVVPEPPALRLEIEAYEQSWVQAAFDGGEMKEALLQPGERLTWTATKQMELTIGNAGGLALSFNGEPLAALGQPGQVVRLHLTKDGLDHVRRSSPPRPPQPPPSTLSIPPQALWHPSPSRFDL